MFTGVAVYWSSVVQLRVYKTVSVVKLKKEFMVATSTWMKKVFKSAQVI